MQEFIGSISQIKRLAQYVLEVDVNLMSPKNIVFQPGQEIEVVLGNQRQNFVITSLPEESGKISFCTGLHDGNSVSESLKKLRPDEQLKFYGPLGDFIFSHPDRDICCVAAGVGIAPFCSIIPSLLSQGFAKKITLVFGLRHEDEMYYMDKFGLLSRQNPNFKFIPTLSRATGEWMGEHGRVTTYMEVHYEFLAQRAFYISGSAQMVEDALNILKKHNHDPSNIKTLVVN